ncbi:hypothetical protein I5168_06670 [Nonlabens sp. SCSIO 43208]|uniref:hypothetical protein n=1 Tax=Nonlabens sp. SCSIO 43208 TaxID=2793009 RepID=UPI002E874711|nr:hypothetical protein [Bacteroidota bacterium]
MKQLLITLLFLSVTHALWSQETERKSTSILFDPPVENRWELGATARTLLSYQTYQNTRYKYDDKFLGLGLGIYADYKVNNVWSLRWETGVDANLGLTPYLSFQTHHRFANRWRIYAGAGTLFNTNAQTLVQRDRYGRVIVNPYLQFGLQYDLSKRWRIDLRYQQNLFDYQRATFSNNLRKEGEVGTLSLGTSFRF